MVYSKKTQKGLFGHVWVMGGVGPLKENLFKAKDGRARGFWPFSSIFH